MQSGRRRISLDSLSLTKCTSFHTFQIGIPNPDDYFQTRVSGLDALKPGFRVLQLWRVEDKQTNDDVHGVYKWENCVKMHLQTHYDAASQYAEERMIFCHHSPVIAIIQYFSRFSTP